MADTHTLTDFLLEFLILAIREDERLERKEKKKKRRKRSDML